MTQCMNQTCGERVPNILPPPKVRFRPNPSSKAQLVREEDDPKCKWADLACGGAELNFGHKRNEEMQEPYLPYPSQQRLEQGQAGFRAAHEGCSPMSRPEQHICEERTYRSYGEWWQAHQRPPPVELIAVRHQAIATTYWPYGTGITQLKGTLDDSGHTGHQFILDSRNLDYVVPKRPNRDSAPTAQTGRRAGCASIRTSGSFAPSPANSPSQSRCSSSQSSPTLKLAGAVASKSYQQALMGSNAEAGLFLRAQA